MRQGPLHSSELICKMGELVLSYNAVAVVCSFTNNNRGIVTIIMMIISKDFTIHAIPLRFLV